MNLKKSALSIALASVLNTGTSQAAVFDMSYDGLFTFLDPDGRALQNTSYPYYGDTTWGYGFRTQISGTLQYDTNTGNGNATVNHFEFFNGGPFVAWDFEMQSIGGGLMLGNFYWGWGGSDIPTQIVLDASGLFAELSTVSIGDVYDANTCTSSGACATPASNDISTPIKQGGIGSYLIGPVPVATSSFNTTGQAGFGTTLGMLSLGTDDGIGGSPMDNGPFIGFNFNFDMTTITVTNVSAVPAPAAVWLFGSGLIGLIGLARRKA